MSGLVSLSGTEFSVLENEGVFNITFVRTGDLSQPVNVEYEINLDPPADGAAGLTDISAVMTGSVLIPAGETTGIAPVSITDDDITEGTESFFVSTIVVDSGRLLFPRTARIDIIDDEAPELGEVEPPLISNYDVTETVLVDGFSFPTAFEFLPTNPDLMFVAEQGGIITVVDVSSGERVGTLLDISDETNFSADRGLMDIAIHPNIPEDPYLYVFHVVDPPETAENSGNAGPDGNGNRFSHLVRYTLDEDTGFTTIVPDSKVVILGSAGTSLSDISGGGEIDSTAIAHVDQPDSEIDPETGEYIQDYLKVDSLSHAGGSLAFGPDGALYVSTGDGTSFNLADPRSRSVQDIDSLAGKILRIDPLTGDGLADNPFVTGPDDDLTSNSAKVYQLGLRNPFSMGFSDSGQLFITNTGWNRYEAIFSGGPGANFGWPWFEGGDGGQSERSPSGYSTMPEALEFYDAVDAGEITVIPPYRAFSHESADPGFQVQAITGADNVINSPLLPDSLQGHYIFTDVVQAEVFSVSTTDRRDINFLYESSSLYAPVHFKQGPDGQVYYVDLVFGNIGRLDITELSSGDPSEPPEEPPIVLGESEYRVLEDGLTRAEALAQAEELGGTLLRIESQAEQDFIVDTFWDDRAIFLDASDTATEGVWVNSDGEEIPYTNWMDGSPDNYLNLQHYAAISRADGGWDDQALNGSDILTDLGWTGSEGLYIVEVPATATANAAIDLDKTVSGTDVAGDGLLNAAGDLIDYTITVTNTGDVALTDVTVTDPLLGLLAGPSGDTNDNDALDVTETWTYTGSYAITQADLDSNGGGDGDIDTTASVTTSEGASDTDSVEAALTIPDDADPDDPDTITFGGSDYVALGGGLTRAEAQTQAEALGGTLLRIESTAELDFVMATFWDGRAIPLDGSDADIEGVWVNSDGEELTYTNWLGGSPDNYLNLQHYAVISREDGAWDDQAENGVDIVTESGWTSTEGLFIAEIS